MIFIKMLRIRVQKIVETRCSTYMQAKCSDDGMRKRELYEGKGGGWTSNNNGNPLIKRCREGLHMLLLAHAHPLLLSLHCSLFLTLSLLHLPAASHFVILVTDTFNIHYIF